MKRLFAPIALAFSLHSQIQAAAPELIGTAPLSDGYIPFADDTVSAGPAGTVYAIESDYDPAIIGNRFSIVKIGPDAEKLWAVEMPLNSHFNTIKADEGGDLFAFSFNSSNGNSVEVIKFGPDGSLVASSHPVFRSNEGVLDVAYGGGFIYFLTITWVADGSTPGQPYDYDVHVRAISGDFGTDVTRHIGPAFFDEGFYAPSFADIGVDAEGNVYAGYLSSSTAHAVVKFAPGLSGALWRREIPRFKESMTEVWGRETGPSGGMTIVEMEAGFPSGDPDVPEAKAVGWARVNANGDVTPFNPLPTRFIIPRAVGSDGGMYALDRNGMLSDDDNGVVKWNPTGGQSWGVVSQPAASAIAVSVAHGQSRFYVMGLGDDVWSVFLYREGPPAWKVELPAGATTTVRGDVGGALAAPLRVNVVDESGTGQGGAAIHFSISTAPAGAVGQSVTTSSTTDAAGRAGAIFTFGDVPAEYQVTATCPDCEPARSTITFTCCGRLSTTDYKQLGPLAPWANDTYDTTTSTIGKLGCALTSLANLNNFYARIDDAISLQTPRTLNSELTALGENGFLSQGRIVWGKNGMGIDRVTEGRITRTGFYRLNSPHSLDELISLVQADLLQKRPVIIGISGEDFRSHFMLASGMCGDKILVYDPGSSVSPRVLYDPRNWMELLVTVVRFRHNP
jgi:hypothetical protein